MEKKQNTIFRPPIIKIYRVLKEYMTHGKVIPANKYRHSDCWVCISGGKAKYYFSDGRVLVAAAGSILYIAKGSHYFIEIESDRYDYIYVDFDFIYGENKESVSNIFNIKNYYDYVSQTFSKLESKWSLKSAGYYEECFSLLYMIYSIITKYELRDYIAPKSRELVEEYANKISEKCSESDFSIDSIKIQSPYSQGHIRRLFKTEFGVSPNEYLRSVRIRRAKSLLVNSDYSVSKIAELTGFNDLYYFSKTFKQITGDSPSSYRQRNKNRR